MSANSKPSKLEKKQFRDMLPNKNKVSITKFQENNSSKYTLIFDTNFLFVPFEFRVEIISEIQRILGNDVSFAIVEQSIYELEEIEKRKTKNKKFLPLIATLIKVYNVSIITQVDSQNYYVDDVLFQLPKEYIIATNDKELKKRIGEDGRKVIFMRQKSYLDIK